jgi:hypothetical protein
METLSPHRERNNISPNVEDWLDRYLDFLLNKIEGMRIPYSDLFPTKIIDMFLKHFTVSTDSIKRKTNTAFLGIPDGALTLGSMPGSEETYLYQTGNSSCPHFHYYLKTNKTVGKSTGTVYHEIWGAHALDKDSNKPLINEKPHNPYDYLRSMETACIAKGRNYKDLLLFVRILLVSSSNEYRLFLESEKQKIEQKLKNYRANAFVEDLKREPTKGRKGNYHPPIIRRDCSITAEQIDPESNRKELFDENGIINIALKRQIVRLMYFFIVHTPYGKVGEALLTSEETTRAVEHSEFSEEIKNIQTPLLTRSNSNPKEIINPSTICGKIDDYYIKFVSEIVKFLDMFPTLNGLSENAQPPLKPDTAKNVKRIIVLDIIEELKKIMPSYPPHPAVKPLTASAFIYNGITRQYTSFDDFIRTVLGGMSTPTDGIDYVTLIKRIITMPEQTIDSTICDTDIDKCFDAKLNEQSGIIRVLSLADAYNQIQGTPLRHDKIESDEVEIVEPLEEAVAVSRPHIEEGTTRTPEEYQRYLQSEREKAERANAAVPATTSVREPIVEPVKTFKKLSKQEQRELSARKEEERKAKEKLDAQKAEDRRLQREAEKKHRELSRTNVINLEELKFICEKKEENENEIQKEQLRGIKGTIDDLKKDFADHPNKIQIYEVINKYYREMITDTTIAYRQRIQLIIQYQKIMEDLIKLKNSLLYSMQQAYSQKLEDELYETQKRYVKVVGSKWDSMELEIKAIKKMKPMGAVDASLPKDKSSSEELSRIMEQLRGHGLKPDPSKIKEYQKNEEVAYIDGGKTTKYKTKHRQYKKTKRKRVKTRKLIKTTVYKRV